jgi:hypothetical protein
MAITGGCHCGAVRYEAEGEALTHALCHCKDCRRHAGAPMVGWTSIKKARSRSRKARQRSTIHRNTAGGISVPAAERVCFIPMPRFSRASLISRARPMTTPTPFRRAHIYKSRNVSAGWRACTSCPRLSVTRHSRSGTSLLKYTPI